MNLNDRLIVSTIVLVLIGLMYLIVQIVIDQRVKSVEQQHIRQLQAEYNRIYEARAKVKDYYDDLYYIRRDIEDCLLNKGYAISNEQKTVKKQDYDYCVSLVHSMRNIPNIPELESIAVLPYPKEITQYDPNLNSY